jgi:DNA-binding transcriptional regulator YdaS (Cro superfamily)
MVDPTVTRAIETMGSAAKLAAALGITRSAVSQWRRIPAWHMAKVSEITGIPADELLPQARKSQASS